ncbi:hypothetical protein [Pelosinus propionicus]|uniref:Uncharacterized protein n=1 Tax=Pelosinus propionicus DSM 13327 TaxID=1123291 RepID=A0A1I4QAR7_9FIRM|nr:hypothetical protein [Pelosinus propionicus]SFM36896.1 hypothetical protein SAMN04490355_10904 [Pelosinus propionicus DSM 13327]
MSDLYVMKSPEDLVGKTVVYVEMNRLSSPAMIITTDGGFLMWITNVCDEDYCNEWGNETEIEYLRASQVEQEMFNRDQLIKRLIKKGIFVQKDFDQFLIKQVEERNESARRYKEQQEERDRREFERLKNKYEGVNP